MLFASHRCLNGHNQCIVSHKLDTGTSFRWQVESSITLCWLACSLPEPDATVHTTLVNQALGACVAIAAAAAAVQGLTHASGASIAQVLHQHPALQQLQLSRNSLADAGEHHSSIWLNQRLHTMRHS
jgi:hypothetical protein